MAPMRHRLLAALAAFCTLVIAAPAAKAEERLPIFDTHVHYSRPAWSDYPPAKILELMDRAGVPRALASSTPDDGTLALHRAAPRRVAPILRPYRDRSEMGGWHADASVPPYLEERLKSGVYRGIGEFHLNDAEHAKTPVLDRIAALAMARDIPLHVHSGAAPIETLLARHARLKILWAHAGMSEPAEVVGRLLDRHASLTTELSFRAGDVAPGGRLDPAWRALLIRHAERFMIGSDTYTTGRWPAYAELIEAHRQWLGQLPREAAEKIAFRNAVRMFGGGDFAWEK